MVRPYDFGAKNAPSLRVLPYMKVEIVIKQTGHAFAWPVLFSEP
jgi:hypothetical protein